MSSLFGAPLWKKGLLRAGLEATDRAGTPVIVRTSWQKSFLPPFPSTNGLSAPPNTIDLNFPL